MEGGLILRVVVAAAALNIDIHYTRTEMAVDMTAVAEAARMVMGLLVVPHKNTVVAGEADEQVQMTV